MQTNKLREALTKILNLTNSLDENCAVDPVEIRDIAKAALAEPVRNYEVGTAEEQYSRMFRECYEWMCMDCKQNKDLRKCALSWAQKPYVEKEGGNDGNE